MQASPAHGPGPAASLLEAAANDSVWYTASIRVSAAHSGRSKTRPGVRGVGAMTMRSPE